MRKPIVLFLAFFTFVVGVVECSDVSLPKTGQTSTYGADDDGMLQKGITWPSPRFVDNGNDTMTDRLTGLVWEKSPSGTSGVWTTAISYCENLSLGGYTDWRLPNRKELLSLVNYGQSSPANWLNSQGFTNVQASYYWSSTTNAAASAQAWIVFMNEGHVSARGKTDNYYVWAVRGGQ
jgi:hypothetical protein